MSKPITVICRKSLTNCKAEWTSEDIAFLKGKRYALYKSKIPQWQLGKGRYFYRFEDSIGRSLIIKNIDIIKEHFLVL